MQTKITVKGIRVFENEDYASVQLSFKEAIKGFAKNDEGEYVEGDVTTISIPRSRFTAQLCDANDDIAMYRAGRTAALGQKEFVALLFGATLKVERTLINEGDTLPNSETVAERTMYLTDVIGVTLTARSQRLLDTAIDSMLGGEL